MLTLPCHTRNADAREQGYTFPYLFDGTQEVAKAYRAACTPEFYVFDGSLQLSYHGQFDSSRPRWGTAARGWNLRGGCRAQEGSGGRGCGGCCAAQAQDWAVRQ